DDAPRRIDVAVEAHILARHSGDFGISAQRRQLDHAQPLLRSGIELLAEVRVHRLIDCSGEQYPGAVKRLSGKDGKRHAFGGAMEEEEGALESLLLELQEQGRSG